jgi:hypothetical protein
LISAKEASRYASAWDYVEHCKRAKLAFRATFLRWLKDNLVPGLAWRKYLFGAPAPLETFVVPPGLQRVKAESSVTSILRAADLDMFTLLYWKKDPLKRRALQEAISTANSSGPTNQNPWSNETASLSPRTKRNILEYAKAQTLRARLKRAELSNAHYITLCSRAQKCGVIEDLKRYLSHQPPFRANKSGLVAENFFILSPAMGEFRKSASGHGVAWTTGFPDLFDRWFAEWTTPRRRHGRRVGDISGELVPLAIPQQGINGEEKERKHPAKERHLKWKKWQDEGLSYAQIAQRHKDQTGEEISRDAVLKALQRLKT